MGAAGESPAENCVCIGVRAHGLDALLFLIGLGILVFSFAESGLPDVRDLGALLKPVGLEVGALLLTVLLGWQIRHIE
jgi:hypothetical protein